MATKDGIKQGTIVTCMHAGRPVINIVHRLRGEMADVYNVTEHPNLPFVARRECEVIGSVGLKEGSEVLITIKGQDVGRAMFVSPSADRKVQIFAAAVWLKDREKWWMPLLRTPAELMAEAGSWVDGRLIVHSTGAEIDQVKFVEIQPEEAPWYLLRVPYRLTDSGPNYILAGHDDRKVPVSPRIQWRNMMGGQWHDLAELDAIAFRKWIPRLNAFQLRQEVHDG
ncbi:MAG: hypothetical protein HGA45_41775 [Chloroflexales bacterium]|nr:hypothetical protein [Chloroflexales bacterium]